MSGRRALGVRWMVAAVTSLGLAAVPLGGAGAEVDPHTDGAYDEPLQLTARQITLVQRVAPQVTLESVGDGRISDKGVDLAAISAIESYDVPAAAMRAYRNAADEMASTMPGCQLPWTLLAGIGRVESDHGRYGGSVLGEDGLPRPAIRGVALNGVGPVAAIADSDDGEWDGDTVWDRAVGPMQFIPTTWAGAGRDGDGDGEENPNDIDDAALASAYYLCPSSGSLLDDATLSAAIYSYNHSDYYVALVKAFMVGYETGVFDIPSPPPPPSEETEEKKDKKQDKRAADKAEPEKDTTTKPSKPSGSSGGGSGSGGGGGGTGGGGGGSGGGGSGGGGGGGGTGSGSSGSGTPTATPTATPTTDPTEPTDTESDALAP